MNFCQRRGFLGLIGAVLIIMMGFSAFQSSFTKSIICESKLNVGKDNSDETNERNEVTNVLKQTRVLCWIMTAPKNHLTKAIHVKNTWGKRCDHLLFVSSKNDSSLPAIAVVNGTEGRGFLWHKTVATQKLLYEQYLDKADWFLRADDDSFVIMENLKLFLKDYDPKESLYFGQRFKPLAELGYMGGGAGFVLSREALKRLVEEGLLPNNTENCPINKITSEDDVLIADCLVDVGVTIVDTRDKLGGHRFNQMAPDKVLLGTVPEWYPQWLYYPQQKGFNCCSEAVISFHYVQPQEMYIFEYFLYHVKVFGLEKEKFDWKSIGTWTGPSD